MTERYCKVSNIRNKAVYDEMIKKPFAGYYAPITNTFLNLALGLERPLPLI